MTRGAITIYSDNKLTHKAYLPSDAYPEGNHCLGLLEAFKKGSMAVAAYIDNKAIIDEESKDMERCWYRKPPIEEGKKIGYEYPMTGENRPFETVKNRNGDVLCIPITFLDYGYEYDSLKKTITVYKYGSKILKITKKNIDRFIELFSNAWYSDIINAEAFDKEKMRYENWDKGNRVIQKIADGKDQVGGMVKIITREHEEMVGLWYLSTGKCRDVWPDTYCIRLDPFNRIKENDTLVSGLFFYYSSRDRTIYYQCPDHRTYVKENVRESRVEKYLAELCRTKPEVLDQLAILNTRDDRKQAGREAAELAHTLSGIAA